MYVCCVWVYVCENFNQQYLLTTLQKDTFWEMFLSLDFILPSDRWVFLRNEVENGKQQRICLVHKISLSTFHVIISVNIHNKPKFRYQHYSQFTDEQIENRIFKYPS